MKKIHAQDLLSGEKFKFLSISKHSSLVKLGVVWLKLKCKILQDRLSYEKYKLSHRLESARRTTSHALLIYLQ